MSKKYQVAAIPVRHARNGGVEVMLVTSRETRRWVVPKGWPWPKKGDPDAAAGEAWEEAGIRGRVRRRCIGAYEYHKLTKGKTTLLRVRVFVLEVAEQAGRWPEASERRRKWFTATRAAALVAEPGLKKLIRTIPRRVASATGK